MSRKIIYWILGLGLLYLVRYRFLYGYFPPETPHKIIGRYLNEPIPSDWNIVYFRHRDGGWTANPLLMAVVDVPDQDMKLAKDLLIDAKHFANLDDLQSDPCFAESEFSKYTTFSDSLTKNSSGLYECYIKKRTIKSDEDSVNTYIAVSNTVVLDVGNKRLMLGMF